MATAAPNRQMTLITRRSLRSTNEGNSVAQWETKYFFVRVGGGDETKFVWWNKTKEERDQMAVSRIRLHPGACRLSAATPQTAQASRLILIDLSEYFNHFQRREF